MFPYLLQLPTKFECLRENYLRVRQFSGKLEWHYAREPDENLQNFRARERFDGALDIHCVYFALGTRLL